MRLGIHATKPGTTRPLSRSSKLNPPGGGVLGTLCAVILLYARALPPPRKEITVSIGDKFAVLSEPKMICVCIHGLDNMAALPAARWAKGWP